MRGKLPLGKIKKQDVLKKKLLGKVFAKLWKGERTLFVNENKSINISKGYRW